MDDHLLKILNVISEEEDLLKEDLGKEWVSTERPYVSFMQSVDLDSDEMIYLSFKYGDRFKTEKEPHQDLDWVPSRNNRLDDFLHKEKIDTSKNSVGSFSYVFRRTEYGQLVVGKDMDILSEGVLMGVWKVFIVSTQDRRKISELEINKDDKSAFWKRLSPRAQEDPQV